MNIYCHIFSFGCYGCNKIEEKCSPNQSILRINDDILRLYRAGLKVGRQYAEGRTSVALMLFFGTLYAIITLIHQLGFAIAFGFQALRCYAFVGQVVDYRLGSFLGQFQVELI